MAVYPVSAVFSADIKDFQKSLQTAIDNVKKVQEAFKNGDFEAVGKISVDSKEASKEITNVENGLKKVDQSEAKVSVSADTKAAEEDLSKAEAGVKSLDGLTATAKVDTDAASAIDSANKAGDAVRSVDGLTAYGKVDADTAGAVDGASKAGDAIRGIDGKTATVKIKADTSDFDDGIGQVTAGAQEGASASEAFKDKISSLGSQVDLSQGVLVAFASACGNAVVGGVSAAISAVKDFCSSIVDVGSTFSSSMSELQAIAGLDVSVEEDAAALEKLEATAEEFGATTQFSASESADALKYMALAGWDAEKSCDALPGVLNLAAASGMDLAAASDMVTDYMSAFSNSFADGSKNAEDFADILAKTQSASNTSAAQMGEAYQNCAATLNSYGQSVETTSQLLGAMANEGTKGSVAGTKLNAIMRDIVNSMDNGAISIGDASVAVADEEGNFRNLTDIIADVNDLTKDMSETERAAAMSATFTSDSLGGMNMVMAEMNTINEDGVDNVTALGEAISGASGCAEEMAKVMNDNLEGDMKSLGSAMEGLQIKIYKCLEGPLRSIVQIGTKAISGLTTAFSGLSSFFGGIQSSLQGFSDSLGSFFDPVKQAWDEFTGSYITDRFAPSIEYLKSLFAGVGEKAQELFSKIGQALSPVIGWFQEIGSAVQEFLVNKVQQFIGTVSSVVSSMIGAAFSVKEFLSTAIDFISQFVDKIGTVLQPVVAVFKKVFDTVSSYLGGELSSKIDTIMMAFTNFGRSVGDIFRVVFDTVTALLKVFTGDFDGAISLVSTAFESLGWFIQDFFGGIWTFISDGISSWAGKLDGLISGALGIDFTFFTDAWEKVSDFVSGIINGIGDAISSISQLVEPIAIKIYEVFTNVSTFVSDTFGQISEKVAPVIEDIKAMFAKWGEWISPIIGWFQNVTGEVESNFLPTMSSIWTAISPVFEAILGALQNFWNWYTSNLKPYFDGLVAAVQMIGEGIISAVQSIWGAIQGAFGFVINIVDAIIKLFSGDFTGAFEAVKNAGQDLWTAFTSIFEAIGTLVTTAFTAICEVFSGWLETIWNFGSDIVQGLWDGISQAGSWIWETVSGWAADIWQTIKDGIGDIGSIGKSIVDGIWGGITGKWEELKTNLGNFATSIGDKVKEVLGIHSPSTVFEGFGNFLTQGLANGLGDDQAILAQCNTLCQKISDVFQSGLAQVKESLRAALSNLITADSFDLSGIVTAVQTVVSTVQATIAQLSGAFDTIVSAATEKVMALYNSALSILSSLSSASVNTVQKMADSVSDVFAYIKTTTVSIAAEMSTQIMAVINAMTNSYINAINQFASRILALFESMRSSIVASMNNMMSQVIQVTAAMVSRVQSTASGLPSWFQSLGKAMMSSLSSGILSGLSSVNSAAGTIVTALVNTFKEGLGIHSPSDVAYWIGQMWLAGLIGGMSKDELIQFTAKYVEDMKTSFSNGDIQIGTMIDTLGIEGAKDLIDYLNRNGDVESVAQVATSFFPLPGSLSDYAITSVFGNRAAPTAGASTNHQGTDIGAASGTPIYAMADGTVSLASYYGGYGNAVMLDHGDGLQSLYGHMSSIATTAGKTVKAGELIGYVGSTGVSTGAHLHFETRQNGTAIDSYPYLGGAAVSSSPKTLAQAIENALTLKEGGTSSSAINAMKSNVTVGTVGSVNQSLWTGSGELIDWITEALQITGYYSAQNLANTVALAMGESGGNPNAINKWDSNWYAGTPSKGLLQTIDSTFQAYALPGHTNIYNPVDNAIASIRYQMDRYGYLRATPGYKIGSSYIPEDMLAMLHKGEVVLPVEDVARLQELANPSSPYQNSHGNILDTVLNLPGSRTGGSGVFDSSPTRQNQGKQDMYITVVSELDGRVVGKSTAKYVESENEWRESRMNRIKGIR